MSLDATTMRDGDITIHVCRRGPRLCDYCTRPAVRLCDFKEIRDGETTPCGRRLCGQCEDRYKPDVSHCRVHALRGDKEAAREDRVGDLSPEANKALDDLENEDNDY